MFRREINVLDKCGTNILRSKGFTLLEIMFATLLLGLVVGLSGMSFGLLEKPLKKGIRILNYINRQGFVLPI